jgi:hypothetical protein
MRTKSLLQLLLISVIAPASMLWAQDYSISFDGVDDYVYEGGQLPDPNGTYEIWFKANDVNTYQIVMMMHGQYNAWLYIMDGKLRVHQDNYMDPDDDVNAVIIADTWYNAVITYDYNEVSTATTLELWLNGESAGSFTHTRNTNWEAAFYIGSCPSNANCDLDGLEDNNFNGLVSGVKISSEVLYSENFEIENEFSYDSNTHLLWNISEGSGTLLSDASGNGNSGTIYGATWSLSNLLHSYISVPGDFSTIQAAFDASTDGDTILVQPGTYYENLYLTDKSVVLGSLFITTGDTNYISSTIIDGSNQDHTVEILGYEIDRSFVLAGFTIQNGNASEGNWDTGGGGVKIDNGAEPTLRNLKVINNAAPQGGGIFLSDGALIMDVLVAGNTATGTGNGGGGINVTYSSSTRPLFINVTISNNTAYRGGGFTTVATHSDMIGCVIKNNTATENGGGLHIAADQNQGTGGPNLYKNVLITEIRHPKAAAYSLIVRRRCLRM